MIRTLNFISIAMTGLVCLGLYRFAEEARIAQADLRATQNAIGREHGMLTVLGAEWARVTQPARIQALAQKHLDLVDRPVLELSSLMQLPPKNSPLVPEGGIRTAKMVVPAPGQQRSRVVRTAALPLGM
jgi:hypothetical protein